MSETKPIKTPTPPNKTSVPGRRKPRRRVRVEGDTKSSMKVGSTRMRMFKALSRCVYPDGLCAKDIKKKCGMKEKSGHLSLVIAEELSRGRIRKWVDHVGAEANPLILYCLTALGQRDFAARKVDTNQYAGRRIGVEWTKARLVTEGKGV